MLRARLVDGLPVSEAAGAHGYSRAAFYLVAAAFDQSGMAGLIDERRGRRGPVKLRPEIVDFIRAEERGAGAQIAEQVAERFGGVLHRRTVERGRGRCAAGRSGRRSSRRRSTTKRCARMCASTPGCPRVWPRPGSPGAGWPG